MVAGRPSVIGKTISGNSTVLRTGTTMKASDGSDWIGWPGVPGLTPLLMSGGGLMARSSDGAALGSRITRQPLATPLCGVSYRPAGNGMWRSKRPCGSSKRLVDGGRAQLLRQHALARDRKPAVVDHDLDLVGIDFRQRDQDQDGVLGLQHVGRRLPVDAAAR